MKRSLLSETSRALALPSPIPEENGIALSRTESYLVTDAVRLNVRRRYSRQCSSPDVPRTGITSLRLRRDPLRDFGYRYDIVGEAFGLGGFAKVFQVRDKYTGELRAAKRVPKDQISDNGLLRRELEMLLTLDHPHVIRLFEWFEIPDSIWMIQEFCTGGEVSEIVGKCTSREALKVIRQILLGLAYLDDRGVVHGDIKLENCMFQSREPESVVKIIDFGLSGLSRGNPASPSVSPSSPNSDVTGKTGTLLYMSPELLSSLSPSNTLRRITSKCDMWAVGIIAHILLTGDHPFWDRSEPFDETLMYSEISRRRVEVSKIDSEEAGDLVSHLLDTNSASRYSAQQALLHPCMRASAFLGSDVHSQLLSNLRSFKRFRPLARVVLTIIAYQSADRTNSALREVFSLLDTDMNGVLSKIEIIDGMTRLGLLIPSDIDVILDSIDADHSGEVDFTEFIAAGMSADQVRNSWASDQAFAWFTQSKIGFIALSDLEAVVGPAEASSVMATYGQAGVLTRSGFRSFIDDVAKIKAEAILPEPDYHVAPLS